MWFFIYLFYEIVFTIYRKIRDMILQKPLKRKKKIDFDEL